ncbi:MAG: hypothetical protein ACOX0H_02040 [Patescibacteria group bacterium]|jgi:hypothetical protein
MKYYKYENVMVAYGEPLEMKIDGKVTKPNGKLMAETIQNGEEITKKEYDNIKST